MALVTARIYLENTFTNIQFWGFCRQENIREVQGGRAAFAWQWPWDLTLYNMPEPRVSHDSHEGRLCSHDLEIATEDQRGYAAHLPSPQEFIKNVTLTPDM